MIYATIQQNNISYINSDGYKTLQGMSAMEVNKNLEKFRNFFSQNFEICQSAVLCRPEK